MSAFLFIFNCFKMENKVSESRGEEVKEAGKSWMKKPRQNLFLSREGTLNIKTKASTKSSFLVSTFWSSVVVSGDLYIACSFSFHNEFCRCEGSSRLQYLAPLLFIWNFCDLSASSSLILAIGGKRGDKNMKSSEIYNIVSNKWKEQPPLNRAYQSLASCLFQSQKAFCFQTRAQKKIKPTYTLVSSLQTKTAEQWVDLKVNEDI